MLITRNMEVACFANIVRRTRTTFHQLTSVHIAIPTFKLYLLGCWVVSFPGRKFLIRILELTMSVIHLYTNFTQNNVGLWKNAQISNSLILSTETAEWRGTCRLSLTLKNVRYYKVSLMYIVLQRISAMINWCKPCCLEHTDRWRDGQTDGWWSGQMDRLMKGWINGWMDRCIVEWME